MKKIFHFTFYVLISFFCFLETDSTCQINLQKAQCTNSNNNVCHSAVDSAMETIKSSMKCAKHHPVGMVVAVVYNRKDTVVTNFGYAETGPKARPVNMDTKFGIGSLSKAFTATLIGMLLSEQQKRYPDAWNTKVKTIMGEDFRLVNQMTTDETTLIDILAHRTAILSYDWMIQFGTNTDISQEYCK